MIHSIQVDNLSKRYRKEWIFNQLSHQFNTGDRTAILGSNGSGKSTFLKVLCGFVSPTQGSVLWKSDSEIDINNRHQYFAFCSPYIELIEDYTLQESIDFHFALKTLRNDVDINQWLKDCGLDKHLNKQISLFSSGMKQRLKLLLTLASEVDVYLLDEPTSNLDEQGIGWYQRLIGGVPDGKIVVVASNQPEEYNFCNNQILMEDFK
ncbi:MAG: ABC transporter ATP-binding protein [Flavobacteriales bacterium]|nr:ABC transporter ATP-binding protein [Flavobacteriales bacterium]